MQPTTSRAPRRTPAAARPARAPRAGVVLVFFALFMFVAMGIAALTIDLGLARLTQRQMQSAADTTALEALRDRDLARDPQTAVDPELRDLRRRLRANRFATWQYVPTLITGQEGEPDRRDGPGVFFQLGEGFGGGIDASAFIERSGYSGPRLRPNYSIEGGEPQALNEPHGDVVSGTWVGELDLDGDGLADGAIGADGNPFHVEDDKYARVDFLPNPAAEAPGGDAVTVRLRRTRPGSAVEVEPPGPENETDVSSSGSTLEWMFGRGTTMAGSAPAPTGLSAREAGIKIRATSVAVSRPVVRASPPLAEHDGGAFVDGYGVGVAPYALHDLFWRLDDVLPGVDTWTDEGGGNFSALLRFDGGQLVTFFDSFPAGLLRPSAMTRVGDKLLVLAGAEELWNDEKNWVVEEAYAPIYKRRFSFGVGLVHRVVAFVRVRTELVMKPDPETGEMVRVMKVWKLANELTPGEPWVAPRNASALFDGLQVSAAELAADGPAWDWDDLINSLYALIQYDRERGPIRAPVIAR